MIPFCTNQFRCVYGEWPPIGLRGTGARRHTVQEVTSRRRPHPTRREAHPRVSARDTSDQPPDPTRRAARLRARCLGAISRPPATVHPALHASVTRRRTAAVRCESTLGEGHPSGTRGQNARPGELGPQQETLSCRGVVSPTVNIWDRSIPVVPSSAIPALPVPPPARRCESPCDAPTHRSLRRFPCRSYRRR